MRPDPHDFASVTPFDPLAGSVIRQAPGEGAGYWAGAPGAYFDPLEQVFYLVYRLRRPRGVEPDRGAELHVARSRNGIEFETIWTGTKQQLNSPSLERAALRRLSIDQWALYLSYVDPDDGRWRTDIVLSPSVDGFELSAARSLFTAAQVGAEGVKDPWVCRVGNLFYMFLSYATATADVGRDELHGSADAYNTGLVRSATALATSSDGVAWQWEGEVFGPPRDGWDRYCARISCLWWEEGVWLSLYDGSADVSENYEERVGLAQSYDLRSFHRVTRDEPLMQPWHAPAALRYFDVLKFPDERYWYYELARPDGSHELRVFRS